MRTLDEIRRELLANTHYACAQRLLEEAYEAGRGSPPPAEAAEPPSFEVMPGVHRRFEVDPKTGWLETWEREEGEGGWMLTSTERPAQIMETPTEPAPDVPERLLARHQPCGCIVCSCGDPDQCHGCGAKHCGTHPLGSIPNPAWEAADKIQRLEPMGHEFTRDLAAVINRHSVENASDTPDFILAEFLDDVLRVWEVAVRKREHWYEDAEAPAEFESFADQYATYRTLSRRYEELKKQYDAVPAAPSLPGVVEALDRIRAKCKQYWNAHNLLDAEIHKVLECIDRDADVVATALQALRSQGDAAYRRLVETEGGGTSEDEGDEGPVYGFWEEGRFIVSNLETAAEFEHLQARVEALQRERDEARERVKRLEHAWECLASRRAGGKKITALIEAAVAALPWLARSTCAEVEALAIRIKPFLPAPQPSRDLAADLEGVRNALALYRGMVRCGEPESAHSESMFESAMSTLRAVESAELGEGE